MGEVVIGVDAHKRNHTLVAVDQVAASWAGGSPPYRISPGHLIGAAPGRTRHGYGAASASHRRCTADACEASPHREARHRTARGEDAVNSRLLGVLAGVCAVTVLVGCGSSGTLNSAAAVPASASSDTSGRSPAAVASSAPASGSATCDRAGAVARRMGITKVTVYTATSDPNHLLGRQGEYTSKAEWVTDGQNSGIETFGDAADARARYSYLRAFRPPIGDGYDYLYQASILRVAAIYAPSQAARLKASFKRSCTR
jgi:hypothetical protein